MPHVPGARTKPTHVPEDAAKCSRCGILMPVPGVSFVSIVDPDKCRDCAVTLGLESEEVDMAKSYGDQITKETVERWARLRREGHSYDNITNMDPLSPSYPTIKRYLQEYGYDGAGHKDGEAPEAKKKQSSYNLPDGWGKPEFGVMEPDLAKSKYAGLQKLVRDTAGPQWARVKTDYDKHPSYVMEKVREVSPGIEAKARKIGDVYYIYFRLAPEEE